MVKKIFSKLGIEENDFFCDKDIYKKIYLDCFADKAETK